MKPVLTAKQGLNADLFADIARLYFKDGPVLDMTWGKGNFWNTETLAQYSPVTMDIETSAQVRGDLRALPFRDEVFGAVVLDPPYAKRSSQRGFKESYGMYGLRGAHAPTGWQATRALYMDGVEEAHRVLQPGGMLVLKCQDEIESGRQRWNHVAYLSLEGFVCEDLLVLVQHSTPAMRVPYQLHARKNHSYFIVQRKA